MKIAFACPSCAAAGSVDAAAAGKSARCKHCGHRFTIPGPGAAEPEVFALDEPRRGDRRRRVRGHGPGPGLGIRPDAR